MMESSKYCRFCSDKDKPVYCHFCGSKDKAVMRTHAYFICADCSLKLREELNAKYTQPKIVSIEK